MTKKNKLGAQSLSGRSSLTSQSIERIHNLRQLNSKSQAFDNDIYLGSGLSIAASMLDTHCLIKAPTRYGKTFNARHILRQLLPEDAFFWIDDPKVRLFEGVAADAADLGLLDRLVMLDTSAHKLLSFNPLHRHGLA